MSRREPTVKVVMLKHNASGRRAGLVLTLDEGLAKSWIAKGWCTMLPPDAAAKSGQTTGEAAAASE